MEIEAVGDALEMVSSPFLEGISWGLAEIQEGMREGKPLSLLKGGAVWLISLPFRWMLPIHSLGHRLKWAGSPEVATKEAARTHVAVSGNIKVFSLNSALGDYVLEAFNFAGTPVGMGKLRERSEEIVRVIEREGFDLVALQEVFSPAEGEYIAARLSELGYDVAFNAGSAFGGWAGFNSGLLSAVKRREDLQIGEVRFQSFDEASGADRFAAKGALMVELTDSMGKATLFTNTHLQSEGAPALREGQMRQIQGWVKGFDREILIGDMNCITDGVSESDKWRESLLLHYDENRSVVAPEGIPYWGVAVLGTGVWKGALGRTDFEKFVREWEVGDRVPSPRKLNVEMDRQELESEYVMVRYLHGGTWGALLEEAMGMSKEDLLKGIKAGPPESSDRQEEVDRVRSLRAYLSEKVINPKWMDRMYTRGFSSNYRVADEYFHLSDHRPIIGQLA